MSVHWNILCLIWINLHCIRNYDKFAKKHGFYPIVCAAKIQGVLITMITYCAGTRITARLSLFVEQWVPVSAGHSTGTAFMLHCCSDPCAGVHWTRKLAFIIMSQSKDCGIFSVQSVATDGLVYHHKISDIDRLKHVLINSWTQLSQDTLNWVINQLSKRLMLVINHGEGQCPCWISSGLILFADDHCCYFHCMFG